MERKGSTAVVTAEGVATALRGTRVAVDEEKVLRMRYGARVEADAPLPQAHGGNEELEDELLLIEMRLLSALKMRKANQLKAAAPRNTAKAHIVAKLKTKKK